MFRNAITVFRIYGIDIRLDPSWFIVAILFAWNLSAQYFPGLLPGQSQVLYVSLGVTAMLLFFGSLLLHELAHSVVAIAFGLQIRNITLFIFGGVAALEHEPRTARHEFFIAIAGPLMSFALAGAGIFLGNTFAHAGSIPAAALFGYLGMVNLVLGIFNLVPAFPMDGGRVLRAALWAARKDRIRATAISARLGIFLGYGFMVWGGFTLLTGGGINGIWLGFIGFFVVGSAKSAYRAQGQPAPASGPTIAALVAPLRMAITPDTPAAEIRRAFADETPTGFSPVVRGEHLLGYIDLSALAWGAEDPDIARRYVPASAANTVPPEMPLMVAAARVSAANPALLVVHSQRLIGIVSRADIDRFVAEHRQTA